MAFPHPQSREDHDWEEDVAGWAGVVGKFFKRAIDVAEDRDAEDDVNPAKDRTLGDIFHDDFVLHFLGERGRASST